MVITLTGDNSFLIRSELSKQVEQFKKEHGDLGLEKIDGYDRTLEALKQSVSGYSFLSPNKLVVLIGPSKIKGFGEQIEQLVSDLPETTTLIIVESNLDKRLSYYKYLNKNTDYRDYSGLSGPQLTDWVVSYASSAGGKIDRQQANYLISRVGSDQMLLSSEIEKLILYSKDITQGSINALTDKSADSTIFELLDAVFSSNPKAALGLYIDQRQQKVEPEQILSMLSWQIHTLSLYMSSKNLAFDDVVKQSKMSPFALQKARKVASKLSMGKLRDLVSDLSLMDVRSKTENFDLDEGLKNFIVELSFSN
jgi:DNA polymerase III subunit delta